MTAHDRRRQARPAGVAPRGEAWRVGPRRRPWRAWGEALLLAGVVLACGVDGIRW